MPDNGSLTTSNQYKRIQELVTEEPVFLVGIGNVTTPWPIEGMPPLVDPEIETQLELVGYVPVRQTAAVIEVTVPTISTININDRYFQTIDPTSLQLLRAAGTQLIYFQAGILHKDLTMAAQYRTLALYRDITFDPSYTVSGTVTFIAPEDVQEATMFYMRNVPPVAVSGAYLEEIVHFVVEARI